MIASAPIVAKMRMFASVLVREYRRQMIHRPRPGVRYVIVNR
jgi:hypothetical protein